MVFLSFSVLLAAYLQPFVDLARSLDGLTASSARQAAKDTLTRFFDTLDALQGTHAGCRLVGGSGGSDGGGGGGAAGAEVREKMRDEVKRTVGVAYAAAVGRLKGSLGPKYVRLTDAELGARLDSFYR